MCPASGVVVSHGSASPVGFRVYRSTGAPWPGLGGASMDLGAQLRSRVPRVRASSTHTGGAE